MGEPIKMFVEFEVAYTDTPFDPKTAYGTLVAGETKDDAILYHPEEFCRKTLEDNPNIFCLVFKNYFIIRQGKDFINTGREVLPVQNLREMFLLHNYVEVSL